jgi:flagellar protein FlaJ
MGTAVESAKPAKPPQAVKLFRFFGPAKVERGTFNAIAIVSVFIIFAISAFGVISSFPLLNQGLEIFLLSVTNYAVVGLLIGLVPPSLAVSANRRYANKVDENLADLFREIAEGQRTGMTFTRALEEATKRDFGPLTIELKRAVAQMSWGVTYERALGSLAKRINTALTRLGIAMIIETARSGGNIQEIMEVISNHIRELYSLDHERRTSIRPYTAVTYIAFAVFVITVTVLYSMFLGGSAQMVLPGEVGSRLSPQTYKLLFYHMALVESVIGGLVAGKMGEGSIVAGLKHVFILLLASFAAFNLLV